MDLVRALGLDSRVIHANRGIVHIVKNGVPTPMPAGMSLIVPTRPGPFIRSRLLSLQGRLRAMAEPLVPRRRENTEESIASFTRRRFGREMLDRVGEPLMAGIHLGDPERLTMSTFPHFAEMERAHGSLIRAMARRGARRGGPTDRASGGGITFLSLDGGMETLVSTLESSLDGVKLLSGTRCTGIERADVGFRVATDGSRPEMEADLVVLAVPSAAAAGLLRKMSPESAQALSTMRAISSATVSMAFEQCTFRDLDGHGFVVPASEGFRIRGCTFSSRKFTGRAPEGGFLLRAFVAGDSAGGAIDMKDTEIVQLVRDELFRLIELRGTPVLTRVFRFDGATPQYEIGHEALVRSLDDLESIGIFLAGSPYHGVGIPSCIEDGRRIAGTLATRLRGQHVYQEERG